MNLQRLTRRSALGLVATGSVFLISDSRGFNQITSDRLASVTTADDANALVGFYEADYAAVPKNSFETVAYVANNLSEPAIFDYQISTNQNGVSIRFDGQEGGPGDVLTGSITIDSGAAEPIALECSKPGQTDGNEVLSVDLSQVETTSGTVRVTDVNFELGFICEGSGSVLEILDVRGLTNGRTDRQYEAAVDVEETENVQTEGFQVELTITGASGGLVYDQTRSLGEIKGGTVTTTFSDIGTLPEDDYEYTVTADADNATATSDSDMFVVAQKTPPNLVVTGSNNEPDNSDITFDMENRGETEAVIEAVSFDSTTRNNVSRVERNGDELVRTDGAGALDGLLDVGGQKVAFYEAAIIPAGGTATFRIGHFTGNNGAQRNMKNEDATLTLSLTDYPDQQIVVTG